jgi:phage-related baseplate assembly protein
MSFRFAAPPLLNLGSPPDLASVNYEVQLAAAKALLVQGITARGGTFDTDVLESEPAVILTEDAVYRDGLRRREIDDAVAQTYLSSASGEHLDARAADYGVVRRVVQFANPLTNTPEILEDDDSLRLRAHLAWEALSVAGPSGAYVFHALDAHPSLLDAVAYGPESGFVAPGEVLVVLQARGGNSIATDGMVDAVAARLDAIEVVYANGSSQLVAGRNDQSVRPLGARVTVMAGQPLIYNTTATLYVEGSVDREGVRTAALERLEAYQASRRRIGARVPASGREAALTLMDLDGLAAVEDVDVVEGDIIPNHTQIPIPGDNLISVVVR